jgi:hypothetical protein
LLGELPADRAARVAFILATSSSWGPTDRARRADVSADLSRVHIRRTKRSTRDRVVPIVLLAHRELLEFAVRHAGGTNGLLFQRWSNHGRDIRAACKRAGIAPCSPNDLRRTFGVWLRASGAPPDLIAPCMGHKDSTMVERVYGRLPPELLAARIQDAVSQSSTASTLPVGLQDCVKHVPDTCDSTAPERRMRPMAPSRNRACKDRKTKRSRDAARDQRGSPPDGPCGNRTHDLGIKNPLLCRLS